MNQHAPIRPGKSTMASKAYSTALGSMYVARIEEAFQANPLKTVVGKVSLILTSPPFPLLRKKTYGNSTGTQTSQRCSAMPS